MALFVRLKSSVKPFGDCQKICANNTLIFPGGIAGMCDKLIQNYFGVDIQAVWLTATHHLSPLKMEIEIILRDIERV